MNRLVEPEVYGQKQMKHNFMMDKYTFEIMLQHKGDLSQSEFIRRLIWTYREFTTATEKNTTLTSEINGEYDAKSY